MFTEGFELPFVTDMADENARDRLLGYHRFAVPVRP